MQKIWNFFLEQNKFSYLLIIALLGFGVFALIDIPKESAPEIQIPIGVVSVALPGASALDVEMLVTNKVEQGLQGNLTNLKKLTSTSREGGASIVAEFEADANITSSIQELKDAVDKVKSDLPDDASEPFVSEVDFVDQPVMTIAIAGNKTDEEFSILADQFESEIESIPGVSHVEQIGVRNREVTVVVRDAALTQYGLQTTDVADAVRAANLTFPIGSITSDGVRYAIAFEGDIASTEEIKNIPVTTRGDVPVFIRDLATVRDDLSTSHTTSRLSINGEPSIPSISFDVYKSRGGDITRITDAVSFRIEILSKVGSLLDGLTIKTVLDSGDLIKQDLTRLTSSGVQTVLLVVLLLIVALGWREALVAGVAIPLSFLIGFIGLYASGNTINFISLFALILAVGILVDSAIVMVEGINRRMKENPAGEKIDAAKETLKEFSTPLIAGTLTTVAMFSGLFLVGGISGQFISGIPFTINFVLFASLLVALGFIPLIASLFLRRRNTTPFEQKQIAYAQKLEVWYRKKLENILSDKRKERIFLTIISIGFVLAMSLPFTGLVKVIFFEQEDIEWLYAQVELPQGTAREVTDITSRRVEEVLYTDPAIASFVTTVGASSAFASNSGGSQDEKYANYFINLDPNRKDSSTEIVARLQEKMLVFDEFIVDVGQPNNGPPTGTPIVIKFIGEDMEALTTLALEGSNILKSISGTTNIKTSTDTNSTEYVLTLDKAKAAAFGFTPQEISRELRSAVFGVEATTINTLSDDIKVIIKKDLNPQFVEVDETNEVTIDAIENLTLTSRNGSTVPVSTLVGVSIRESSTSISHEDGERVVTLSSDVSPSGNVREIVTLFKERIGAEVLIPQDTAVLYGGENEESNEAFVDVFIALIVGILLMLAILVLQFNSYRHTIYVLSIVPFSLIGIMVGLAITQKALSFPSIMGFIALSGIVVNNAILLIDQMNMKRRVNKNIKIKDAVIDASVSRLRPILLTTFTTVIGVFPLTFASDLWAPLAYAIMFGLSFSVIITLLLVPIIYHRKPGVLK